MCLSADQLNAAHTASTTGCCLESHSSRLLLLLLGSVRFLWGYDPSMDSELQEVFNTVVAAGVNVSGTHTGAACVNNREVPGVRALCGVAKRQQSLLFGTALPKAGAAPVCLSVYLCVRVSVCVCVCPDQIFDTADSYGTGALNGRSEELLGQFIR